MRFLKFLLKLVLVLVVLLVAAVLVLPLVIDPNDYKPQIAEAVKKQTGRDLTVAGDIKLKTLPWLGVRIEGAELSNAEGFDAPHFAKVGVADVAVKVLPLLTRNVQADAITLEGLDLNLEKKSDGSSNWDDLAGPGATERTPPASEEGGSSAFAPQSIAIDGVTIRDARVRYADATSGQEIVIENLALETGTVVPGEPVDLSLGFDAAGLAPDTTANVTLDGRIDYSLEQPVYGVEGLKVTSALRGGAVPGGTLDVNVNAADVRFDGNSGAVTANALEVRTGDVNNGDLKLQAALGGNLAFDLEAQKLSLTNLSGGLPVIVSPAASGKAALSGAMSADLAAQSFELDQLALDGTLEGDATGGEQLPLALRANGVVDLGAGIARLDTFSLDAPGLAGGGSLDVSGLNATPSGGGQLNFDDIDIRKLMAIAGVSVPPMQDADALRTASLNATVQAGESGVNIEPLKLTLDGTTIEGKAAIVDMARNALRFDLSADTLNVDRYLPPAGASDTSGDDGSTSAGSGELPIDTLRALDIDGRLRVGSLKAANVSMANIDVGITAKDGVIRQRIDSLSLYGGGVTANNLLDVSGDAAKLGLDTQVNGIAGDRLLADLGVEGLDLSGGSSSLSLKAQGGGDVAAQRFRIDGLSLNADLSGKAFPGGRLKAGANGNVDLDLGAQAITTRPLTVSFAGAKVTSELAVQDYAGDVSYAGKLSIAQLNLKSLMRSLGQAPIATADPKALTSIALNSSVKGTKNSVALDGMTLNLDGSKATGQVSVADFAAQAVRFDLDIDQLNVDRYTPPASQGEKAQASSGGGPATVIPVDLIRSLNVDGELRVGQLIATGLTLTNVKLKSVAKGGKATLHPLNANLYGGSYSGNIRIDASGDTPTLSLDENLRGVQAAPLLEELQGSAPVSGTANASIRMTGSGALESELRRTLNGTANLEFADGAIEGINLLGTICRALSGLSLTSLNTDNLADAALGLLNDQVQKKAGGGEASGENRTRFSAVSATVNVANGVANNPDLDLKSPLLRVTGNGDVNLVQQSLDYLVTAALVSSCEGQGGAALGELAGIGIPVKITGPFDDLSYKPQLTDSVIAAVRKAAVSEGAGAGDLSGKAQEALDKLGGDKVEAVKEVLKDGGAKKAVEGLLEGKGVEGALEGLIGGNKPKAPAAAPQPQSKAEPAPKPKPQPKAEPATAEEAVKDAAKKGLGNLFGN